MSYAFIINADDYGLTPGVSRGIREAHTLGIVTSTTAMMNFPHAARALQNALEETPRLGLGVHLVLTAGHPCLAPKRVPSLVDETGKFRRLAAQTKHLSALNPDEIRAEWRAQIEAFRAVVHRPPDHLDAHHHIAYFTPALFRIFLEFAREYDCAIRFPLADAPDIVPTPLQDAIRDAAPTLLREFTPRAPTRFFGNFYGETATESRLRAILTSEGEGTAELMCHPAFVDEALRAISSYQDMRAREREILIAASAWIEEEKRIRFSDL